MQMLTDQPFCVNSIHINMKKMAEKKWYIFYTCPRAEKKANKNIISLGYETFLPLKKECRIWKNRQRKLIEVPLFPSYVFVYAFHYNLYEINKVHGISTYITCAGNPVCIPQNDVMSLKIMQEMDAMIVKNSDFIIGDRIRIIDGPLCGYEGVLVKEKGINKFGINIDCVNLMAIIDVDAFKIEKLKQNL